MNKLNVVLENCYGINSLTHEFDFTDVTKNNKIQKRNTFAIYAGNGVMKTSFANTFLDLSNENHPKEKIHNLTPVCNVTCDGTPLPYQDIFVIKPFIPQHEAQNISTLLVSNEKKTEYDKIYSKILKEKNKVIVRLNQLSGVKKTDIDTILLNDLNESDFFECLELYIDKSVGYDFSAVKYNTIFNDDVLNLLKESDVIENIAQYTEIYNDLIDNSPYFKRGVFNPHKADSVAKTLKKERFFEAEHTVNLKGETAPISEQEFFAKLKEAKKTIIENAELKKIQDLLTKKESVRSFQEVIINTPEIIVELGPDSLDEFKTKLWKSYILNSDDQINNLLTSYRSNKVKLERIESEAISQQSKWEEIIEIFKDRFHVPFIVEIANKKSAILGKESPNIVFKFDNGSGSYEEMSRDKLESLEVLSQGELRALYLLNIIFEIEARKYDQRKTLFIVDDVADSFDYKNKYAIISYLHENAKIDFFYQIIMTHNFDFFRTIQSRLLGDSKWSNSLIAQKSTDKIELLDGGHKNITDPFNYWRKKVNRKDLFNWEQVPGNDSLKLVEFLKHNFYIDRIKTPQIEKIDASKTIKVFTENKYISLCLKDEKTKVDLIIDGVRTDEFIVEIKDDELNIYQNSNDAILIAMIPFVRNLIEFSLGKKDDSYPLLTNLLHIKGAKDNIPCTEEICISDIKPVFEQCIKTIDLSSFDDSILIYDLILSEASKINASEIVDGFNLENKIVLSIAIRLLAEKFMWSKVTNKSSIKGSQTGHLFERYKEEFSQSVGESSNIETLDLVNLITPENIHLNSFMYEPILDMSEHELKSLYSSICKVV